jgi:pyruvate dehydrogenase E2 component (dihydrolipoamide acetyltransferase)
MSQPIKMPDLGSDMTEGTLLNWVKAVGDQIQPGDIIAEIETDKATVEVPVEVGGTIVELSAKPGDTLQVGSVLGYVGTAGETAGSSPAPAANHTADGAAAPAPVAAAASAPAPAAPAPDGNGSFPGGVKASPVARRIAEEMGVDLNQVHGTGPGGRVVKEDVEAHAAGKPAPAVPAAAPAPTAAPKATQPAPTAAGITSAATFGALPEGADVEIIDTSKLRGRIATRMVQSKQQIPHFYVTADIDVAAMLDLRKQLNANISDDTMKISVNDMIVKATALTLVLFPNLNTHFYGDKLVRYKRINIGIAVALPGGGLINVVAKDADKVALGTLAKHNKEMIARARDGKVKPDDVQGSTFTVSNLGAYDVEHFMAIVNPPEAGILAVGSAKQVPVVLPDGTIGIGNRMKVTISVDHRVSDGAEGADFMKNFKEILENPMRLLV